MFSFSQRGITLVEVIIGASIVSVITVAVLFSISLFITTSDEIVYKTKALFLAEEGVALVQYLRSDDWSTIDGLALGTSHYLVVATSSLAITSTPEIFTGGYTRAFTLAALYRNADDDIVDSSTPGAVSDTDARLLTVTVDYPNGSVVLESVLTNIHDQ